MALIRFRPLSRQIGSYTGSMQTGWVKYYEFPAPFEVDRELFIWEDLFEQNGLPRFPAPLEVDTYLYKRTEVYEAIDKALFPAPSEVDRFLYTDNLDQGTLPVMFPAPLEVDR